MSSEERTENAKEIVMYVGLVLLFLAFLFGIIKDFISSLL